jgi:hypothetical protein
MLRKVGAALVSGGEASLTLEQKFLLVVTLGLLRGFPGMDGMLLLLLLE